MFMQVPQLGAPNLFAPPAYTPAGSEVAPSFMSAPRMAHLTLGANYTQAPAMSSYPQAPAMSSYPQAPAMSSNSQPAHGGLHFSGLSPFAFQSPVYYTKEENEQPAQSSSQPAYAPALQPPAFNFLNNFDFTAAVSESPKAAAYTPEHRDATSTMISSTYAATYHPVEKPTAVARNPGYDPEDNGTRILTDGMHNVTSDLPATRILNTPTKLGSMPLPPMMQPQPQNEVEQIGNATAGNDDPNRIPTFVKVRGLPSSQDPRIVARKKKSKKSSGFCGNFAFC